MTRLAMVLFALSLFACDAGPEFQTATPLERLVAGGGAAGEAGVHDAGAPGVSGQGQGGTTTATAGSAGSGGAQAGVSGQGGTTTATAGSAGASGAGECTPTATACQPGACGILDDGCGSQLPCGECPDGQSCGVREQNGCSSCEETAAGTPTSCDELGPGYREWLGCLAADVGPGCVPEPGLKPGS